MGFLRLLAAGRTAVLDGFFSGLTYFGSELAFMAAALLMFWCIDKRQGYYVFLVGAFGTICNQFLKLAFRIPRPWVLDPEFQIVEAARADATGYSFPSGHTQNIVGTTASLFACRKEKWVRIVCAVLMVLVPFSRMYLGVHTPLDVGVSFVLALALAAALYPAFRTEQTAKRPRRGSCSARRRSAAGICSTPRRRPGATGPRAARILPTSRMVSKTRTP